MSAPAEGHRIEIEPSPQRVTVSLNGITIADSTRTLRLRETGYAPVQYFPSADVRMDLLEPSATRTACPFKGTASYYSARIGGRLFQDVAWSYADPLPEAGRIRGCLAFFPERVEAIQVAPETAP